MRPEVAGRIDGIRKLHTWLPDGDDKYREALTKDGDLEYFDFAIANLIRVLMRTGG